MGAAAIAADQVRSARALWRRTVVVRLLHEPTQLELHVGRPLVRWVKLDNMRVEAGH